jgi:RNA polymerase sigma-70 factor (ECF subfamily)
LGGGRSGWLDPGADFCDFAGIVCVLHMNDEPAVHHPSPELRSPADFATFMRNYQDMVYTTAFRLVGTEAQAEDISQDVFLKAYERFEVLAASPSAGGWLKTVATNLSLNHLQRYRRRWRFFSELAPADAGPEGEEGAAIDFAAPETLLAELEAGDRRRVVEEALRRLPEHQRVPLVLFHFEDLPYDEIARRLGVSLAKVKTDILRARAALARILARDPALAAGLGETAAQS